MNNNEMRRDVGLVGAVMMGLGSIVGTGVFVSIGVAAGVAGANVLIAIFLASLVAICNGLSSAQLAANHPVSGGTYEYGHRWLTPTIGFVAGWLFLCAKSASAATAALGLAGYIQSIAGIESKFWLVAIALFILILVTAVVLVGIRRTNFVNMLIVGVTLSALAIFVIFGFRVAIENAPETLSGQFTFTDNSLQNLLYGTALMFVAYTGYGRIATLGEEVKEPRRTIPRAMIATLAISMFLYLAVGFVAVAIVGPEKLATATETSIAPLLYAANQVDFGFVGVILFIGAMTAMLGVLLNLLLGLSRVLLAMARRSDVPTALSKVNSHGVPGRATIVIAIIIASLVLIGDVKLAWSFSAFTVLIYYAITNFAATRLPKTERLYPSFIAWGGLVGCLSLAIWITPVAAVAGTAVLGVGLAGRAILKKPS